jgi:hypothetical protein
VLLVEWKNPWMHCIGLNGAKNDVHRKLGQVMLAKSTDKEDV